MTKDPIKKRVFYASSIEDVRECLKAYFPLTLKSLVLVCMLYVRIFLQNLLISAICKITFKTFSAHSSINKIVVYTQGIFGDHIVVLPALAALKERFPHAELIVITFCGNQIKELLSSVGFIDRVISLDSQPVMRDGLFFRLDERLDGVTCDLFIDLAPYGNRGWMGAVLREIICAKYLKARFAIGFRISTWRGPHSINKIQYLFQANEPRRPRQVLRELGISAFEEGDLLPTNIHVRETIQKRLISHFGEIDSLAVIIPGGNLSVQRWPTEHFQSVAVWLEKHRKAQVVTLGTESERMLGDVVTIGTQRALNLAGKTTIQDVFEILKLSKICITNDTGTMHAASIIGIPTLAIFGTRLSPHLWFPLGDTTRAIFCLIECSLCHEDNCVNPNCLNLIEESDVIEMLSQIPF